MAESGLTRGASVVTLDGEVDGAPALGGPNKDALWDRDKMQVSAGRAPHGWA